MIELWTRIRKKEIKWNTLKNIILCNRIRRRTKQLKIDILSSLMKSIVALERWMILIMKLRKLNSNLNLLIWFVRCMILVKMRKMFPSEQLIESSSYKRARLSRLTRLGKVKVLRTYNSWRNTIRKKRPKFMKLLNNLEKI